MTNNVRNLPDKSVILDLDSYERPEEEVKPPFVVQVAGRKITFEDPQNIDWRELAAVEAPGDILRAALDRADLKHIRDQKILPTFKFAKLIEAYYDYYELQDKIDQARRAKAFSQA